MQRSPDAIFFEEQPLRDNRFFYLVLAGGLGMIGFFGYAMYVQLVQGEPFGDRPMGDTGLAVMGSLYILLGIAMLYVFVRGSLVTEVRSSGLYIRYFPFHFRFQQISLDGIESCRAVTYKPIREYGGWGIRSGRGKKAYNVSGNTGVEIVYKNGTQLLIGSRKHGQLESAIDSIRP